jgi:hypothetical protein
MSIIKKKLKRLKIKESMAVRRSKNVSERNEYNRVAV